MAKRPLDDDEDQPKVRKRRYKPKLTDDDDDAPPARRGQPDDDDDEDEDNISTGNVYLDIALDFRDDCIDWAKENKFYAIIICVIAFLVFTSLSAFIIYSIIHYLKRPSLEQVVRSYDIGLFPETKFQADHALKYISAKSRPEARAPFLFLQGAAVCAIAERVPVADQRDYYLMSANFLRQASVYNFLSTRAAEGWFLLGKSLFHIGELEQCREPLLTALYEGYQPTKEAHWYLANAYLLGSLPDLQRAKYHLYNYQNEPTILEEELAESRLLETVIVLHLDGIEEAERVFRLVPHFRQFELMRTFVDGHIEFFKAREQVQIAIAIENDPNPTVHLQPNLQERIVVPASPDGANTESEFSVPDPIIPGLIIQEPLDDRPTAPVPVDPMDAALLRELMRPRGPPAAVLAVYDETSELQRRMAAMQVRYADDAQGTLDAQGTFDDEIIILPREDSPRAPVPPSTGPETDPLDGDPILRRITEHRNAALSHYDRAIALFTEVVIQADVHNPWGRFSRLLIGICYLEKGRPQPAIDHFLRLFETFPESPEAVAANFLLGEHHRMMQNHDAGFRALRQAFDSLRQNPNYASLWLPKYVILERTTEMIRADIDQNHHANAVRLLSMLRGVMPGAERVRLLGESFESWAEYLQSQADGIFGEEGDAIVRDAESKRRNAGTAFAALAQIVADTREFSETLWRGAENYRIGKDFRRAIIEYRKFSHADFISRRPELHLRLGEMYLHLDALLDAVDVLEDALLLHPRHNLVPQIRLVLSYAYRELKEWDKAKALLQLNLIGDAAPTSAPYRDSMYLLGEMSFARGDLAAAIPYLEDAIRVHPDAVQAADANYLLAMAYLRQAESMLGELTYNTPDAVRRAAESTATLNRRRALFYLDQTERILLERQKVMSLTESERMMLRNTLFMSCSILLRMEQFEQVIPRLNTAATMYQDRPESLDALVQMSYAMRRLGQEEESKKTLRRAEVILNLLEENGIITDGTAWRDKIQGQ